MQILILSNCQLVESQGSGYVIINTAKSLIDSGHTVDLIPPSAFSFLSSWKNRANIYRLAVGMAIWVVKNRKLITNYQLIIVYGAESGLAIVILKKVFRLNIPVILHSNGLEVHVDFQRDFFKIFLTETRKWYHLNKRFLFDFCYHNVDAILTVSRYDRDFAIEQMNISPGKIFANEPCLPDIFFNYNFEKPGEKKNIITYCGSWIERKGINSIKNIIPSILQKYPQYTFRIIGVGTSFRVEEHFPDDIIKLIEIYPLVENKEDIVRLYSESAIFLFPSFCESFGLVVAEAMFCNCAVITGPTGMAANIKNNEEALVLQIPDDKHVYEAIEKLITDDDLRINLAYNGKKHVENLNWVVYKNKLNSIIKTVINNT